METSRRVVPARHPRVRDRLARWLRPARELERARRAADAELLRLVPPPPRLAWRSAELTAGSHRLELAQELRKLVNAADSRYLPNASPIDRGGVRKDGESLLAFAARLSELTRPVEPRGVLLLERILHDSDSPLYEGLARRPLGAVVADAADALEPRR